MFMGINILAQAMKWGLKWALGRAQNIFMLKKLNCIIIVATLEGIKKMETEKNNNKTAWRVLNFFHQPWMKMLTNTVMASYSVGLFDSLILTYIYTYILVSLPNFPF